MANKDDIRRVGLMRRKPEGMSAGVLRALAYYLPLAEIVCRKRNISPRLVSRINLSVDSIRTSKTLSQPTMDVGWEALEAGLVA